ncbi:MAG: sensor domain-containing diguanylate cyclase [Elusimicrobiota bacterium]
MGEVKNNNTIQYIVLPLLLVALFLILFYHVLAQHFQFVLFFPYFAVFTVVTFFSYGLFTAIIITALISLMGFSGILFVDGIEKIYLLIEVGYLWVCLILLQRYGKRDHLIERRHNLLFEELDEKKTQEELGYHKDSELLTALRDRLDKHYRLSNLANVFNSTLGYKEINKLIIQNINDIINIGEVSIVDLKTDNIFVKWVIEQEVPLLITDLRRDYRFSADIARISQFKSLMILPLWNGETMHSCIQIGASYAGAYREEDLRMVLIIADIASLAITNAVLFGKIQELVIIDSLTGVFNRRYFMEICEEEINRSKRYSIPLSLLLVDIDHFKRYNDTFGHLSGDKILKDVSRVFKENSRETDLVARYGGEEFVLLLSMTDIHSAFQKAEKIRGIIEEKCGVTVSIGIAQPGDNKSVLDIIDKADKALYKAKTSGRNRVVIQ